MRKKIVILYLAAVIAVAVIAASTAYFSLFGWFDKDPYTETVECTVMGDTSQPAMGEMFVFKIDNQKSLKLQKSQCYNMETVKVGDTFKAVMVQDEDEVLQCLVRVTDIER